MNGKSFFNLIFTERSVLLNVSTLTAALFRAHFHKDTAPNHLYFFRNDCSNQTRWFLLLRPLWTGNKALISLHWLVGAFYLNRLFRHEDINFEYEGLKIYSSCYLLSYRSSDWSGLVVWSRKLETISFLHQS